MKNFQGLRKCATGAVVNTEDFMKSNQSNTGSMLEGAASISDRSKRRKKTQADKNNRSWQRSNKKKTDRSCRNNYIGN